MEQYNDPVIQAYIDLIKANTGSIRVFFQGEPIKIPASDLPCAMISKRVTEASVLTNSEDQHAIGMSITVITDIRNDLSTDQNASKINAGVATLYDIVEGRNDDFTLKATSLLSILRHNIAVDLAHGLRTDLGSNTRVDYGLTLRNRAPELWSVEARIDFIAVIQQVR